MVDSNYVRIWTKISFLIFHSTIAAGCNTIQQQSKQTYPCTDVKLDIQMIVKKSDALVMCAMMI